MDHLNKKEEILTEETYELYDRNIRLWGKNNQIKLNQSNVLLINLNSAMTELAKNLVLAGINLCLYDKGENGIEHLINLDDVKSNFFLELNDIGHERAVMLREKLCSINNYVKIQILESLDDLKLIQCACVGFKSFKETEYYQNLLYKNNHSENFPMYVINISGTFGFFYNNIRLSENKNISKDEESRQSVIEIQPFSFSDMLCKLKAKIKKSDSKKFEKKNSRNYLAIAICVLESRMMTLDTVEVTEKCTNDNLSNGFKDRLTNDVDELISETLNKLVNNFNIEFNPVCAVIAGIVSQEVFNVLTNPADVRGGLYTYDAEQQFGDYII